MSNEVYVHATIDLDEVNITDLTDYLESADYKVFSDDSDGAQEALDWINEEWEGLIKDDAANDVLSIVNENGIDYILDCLKQNEIMDYVHKTFTPDQIMGPIESTDVIKHLEGSIDAMVIRGMEEPTKELCGVFLTYLDEFKWREVFIKLMRHHGVLLETILKCYIEDENIKF